MSYLLGDNETAARRLGLLADVFEATTRDFLVGAREFLPGPADGLAESGASEAPAAGLALDLGCGPGHTTRLLSRALGSASTVGIDSSENFIRMATDLSAADVTAESTSFLVHDITATPFPIGPADLIYSRFLLMHVDEPRGAMSSWGTQLTDGGVQLIEELESVATGEPLLRQYLQMMEAALADQGRTLYIGAVIGAAAPAGGMSIISNQVKRVMVPAADAANLYFLNIRTLRSRPFVAANYTAAELTSLETGLKELASGKAAASGLPPVEWRLRQMVIRHNGERT